MCNNPYLSLRFHRFATDYYDLGFGVYFEWTVADNNQVTVHVEESEDEYDEEEAAAGGEGGGSGNGTTPSGDIEAEAAKKQKDPNKPRMDEIIPVKGETFLKKIVIFRHSEEIATRRFTKYKNKK